VVAALLLERRARRDVVHLQRPISLCRFRRGPSHISSPEEREGRACRSTADGQVVAAPLGTTGASSHQMRSPRQFRRGELIAQIPKEAISPRSCRRGRSASAAGVGRSASGRRGGWEMGMGGRNAIVQDVFFSRVPIDCHTGSTSVCFVSA
jgi:hypothetical protein